MKEKYIAYQGQEFTIEWYFDDRNNSDVLEYFKTLPEQKQRKLGHLFRLLGDSGKIYNEEQFRNEEDQIYAFKPTPHRFLCFFFQDAKVIITNGFEKKTNKLPIREKEKALKLKKDYVNRCRNRSYYD